MNFFNELVTFTGRTVIVDDNVSDISVETPFTVLAPTSSGLTISGANVKTNGEYFHCTFINSTIFNVVLKHNVGTIPFFTSGGLDYTLAANSFVVCVYDGSKFLIKTT